MADPHNRPYQKCHAMLHEMRHVATIQPEDEYHRRRPFGGLYGMVGFESQCVVCGAVRVRWITRSGAVMNRYYYPSGYTWDKKKEGGTPAPKGYEWRSSFVAHLFEGVEE
jgi:hypothetical protein